MKKRTFERLKSGSRHEDGDSLPWRVLLVNFRSFWRGVLCDFGIRQTVLFLQMLLQHQQQQTPLGSSHKLLERSCVGRQSMEQRIDIFIVVFLIRITLITGRQQRLAESLQQVRSRHWNHDVDVMHEEQRFINDLQAFKIIDMIQSRNEQSLCGSGEIGI